MAPLVGPEGGVPAVALGGGGLGLFLGLTGKTELVGGIFHHGHTRLVVAAGDVLITATLVNGRKLT